MVSTAWLNVNFLFTFSTRSSTSSSLSMSVPLTSVSIITCSIGRLCFSMLFGNRSTDDVCPSVPLDVMDARELFGDDLSLHPLISSKCLSWSSWSYIKQVHVKFCTWNARKTKLVRNFSIWQSECPNIFCLAPSIITTDFFFKLNPTLLVHEALNLFNRRYGIFWPNGLL